MFEHLVDNDPPREYAVAPGETGVSFDDATPAQLLDAQASTAAWLESLTPLDPGAGSEPPAPLTIDEAARAAARAAFCSVTDPYQDPLRAKTALLALHAPPAVRHLAGMLSQYDWAFVKQAQEIRGYIVAKLVEHTQHKDPKVSLQALRALGTVTEIGAFTERVEISRPTHESTPDALVERIRDKLKLLLPQAQAAAAGVEDAVEINPP